MLRLMFALLIFTQLPVAQEVRGPFDVGLLSYTYYDNHFAAIGADTVGFVSFNSLQGPSYWAYSESAESLVVAPTQICPTPEGWFSDSYGPVLTTEGWAMLEYQFRRETEFDFGYNRLVLIRGQRGEITTTLLDSGRTHPYWVDSLSRYTSSLSVRQRMDGGFYTQRYHYFAVRDSSDDWVMTSDIEIREYESLFADPLFREYPCTGALISGPADSLFFISSSVPYGDSLTGCIATRDFTYDLPTWDECIIQYYNIMYSRDRGLRLLTGYSPVLQVKELRMDGECRLLAEVNAVAEFVFANRNWGYALLTNEPPMVLLGQLGADGELVRAPTPLFEGWISFYDKLVTEQGDICLVWGQDTEPGYHTIKYTIIPWDAELDAPENRVHSVPRELFLSAYPNPFNSTVTIRYELARAGKVTLTAYDLQGRVVSTIVDEQAIPGAKEFRWTPESLASGVYFLTLTAPFARATQKVLYLK